MNSSNERDETDVLAAALALGGTGSRINWGIDWGRLSARLAESPPAIAPLARCQLLIKAVNGVALSRREWGQMLGASITRDDDKAQPVALPGDECTALATVLKRMIEGKGVNVRGIAQAASGNVVVVPDFGTGRDRVVASSLRGALYYSLWLLGNPDGPFRKLLCQCQYSKCKRFYLLDANRRGPGAPPRVYCNPEHRRLGNSEAVAQAARDARAKRR